MIRRLLPRPAQSFILLVIWLVANMTTSFGQILLGSILAVMLPVITARFWPDAPKLRSVPKLIRYTLVFLYDVLVANLQVALWIVGPVSRLQPRWLFVPLELEHPFTITVLASTISLTPGTISAHISADRRLLIVHCLHSTDDADAVKQMKDRYERPLMEIFG